MRFLAGFIAGGLAAALAGLGGQALLKARGPRLFGHFRYGLTDAARLAPVDRDGKVLLDRKAARAFAAMQEAAAADGLTLVPVSGFRDLAHQKALFFDDAAARGETLRERARTCAPPGYSEHHTGFSVDLGDGAHRETQLELHFKDTPAYEWLRKNAARWHFEQSFPEGNAQQVSYEPWHWRWVGDLRSFRVFFPAKLGG